MRHPSRRLARLPLLVLPIPVLSACVDEEVVFRDFVLFEDPPTEALSFLGYSDHGTKLTVCGNCHVEKQADWVGTLHAEAWDNLQATGAAQGFCEGCHTINERGNAIEEIAGHEASQDARYEDVQCEACHGPGLTHVTNPTRNNVPLAPMSAGLDLTTGCGECHADTHHPFVEEWVASRHGEGAAAPQYRTREGCDACHGGMGALAAWGIRTTYIELGDPDASIGITCVVCHDPHSKANDHQLRWPIDAREVDENLCMKCHQRRAIPDEGSSRGPHSPQGPLLLGVLGTVGWIPPNFEYDQDTIRGTHGSEKNQKLCATCHLNSFTVTDPESGGHVFSATGHLFDPIPCVDAQGIPQADDSCPLTTGDRSFGGCTTNGCHGDEIAALSALIRARERIDELVEELDALLDLVPEDQFDTDDDVYTVAEGSKFNAGLGAIESSAIHNPFLTEALLRASVKIVKSTYVSLLSRTSG